MAGIWRALTERVAGVTNALRFGQRAPEGRIALGDPTLDSWKTYLSDGINGTTLRGFLRAVDSGQLDQTLLLFEEMESKDLHLRGVAEKRRKALTALDWRIVSQADKVSTDSDRKLADDAASFVEEELNRLECFDQAMEHLATAIGPNVAVLELEWHKNRLINLLPIPSHRLRTDPQRPGVVLVTTSEHPNGIEAASPKFVVHVPDAKPGFPFSSTLCHAQAWVYLSKVYAMAYWSSYVEKFGTPFRWVNWPHNATEDQKVEILAMLKGMGNSGYAAWAQGVSMQFVESSQRGTSPHKDLIEWAARQQSIGWLGGNLTTDTTGGTGTFAAASVQQNVAQDLKEDDVKREARTVRAQIVAPIVAFGYRGGNLLDRDRIVPRFDREFREEIDRLKEAQVIEAAQRAGVKVPKQWAYERLGIPEPAADEKTLEPGLDAYADAVQGA